MIRRCVGCNNSANIFLPFQINFYWDLACPQIQKCPTVLTEWENF